jgi:cysteine desulfurase / selenocysteine lyase
MITVKKDFPILNDMTDNRRLIYLDSAVTSLKPQSVVDSVNAYHASYSANIHRGLYPIAERATKAVGDVRRKVAKFINAASDEEIIFTSSTTEAINIIANSWGQTFVNKDDGIVATVMEHHSNFVPWQHVANEKDAVFSVMNIDAEMQLIFDEHLIKKTKLLAITYVSNVLGTINPLKEIIQQCRLYNPEIVIIVDAAQAMSHMNVDVQDLNCDFLVFSGHKMFATTGIGVLYGKRNHLIAMPPFLYGGNMIHEVTAEYTTFADLPNKFEAGTINISGIISLGAAIDYITGVGMEKIQQHEQALLSYSLKKLENIDGLTIYGPRSGEKRGSVIAFTLDDIHPHDIAQVLGDMNICIRAGHHCTMPLHKRLGVPATCRVSFSIYNDEQDIESFMEGIQKVKGIFS